MLFLGTELNTYHLEYSAEISQSPSEFRRTSFEF